MKIVVNKGNFNMRLPVPLWLCEIVLRIGSINEMTKEQKDDVIRIMKECKKYFKEYKGLNIVEVQTAQGNHISIIL